MEEKSLKDRIQNYFYQWKVKEPEKWLPKAHIEDLSREAGYLGDNGDRRLRELHAEGILERRQAGKSIEYRFNF